MPWTFVATVPFVKGKWTTTTTDKSTKSFKVEFHRIGSLYENKLLITISKSELKILLPLYKDF